MILRAFPDITWLKKQISEDFSQWKGSENVVRNQKSWPTVVLNVKTSEADRPDIKGPLSLFTNISGRSTVRVGNRQARIDNSIYFLTNSGQFYSLGIEEKTETFNIHFGNQFVRDLYQDSSSKSRLALDYGDSQQMPCFFNQTFQRNRSTDYIINHLYLANQDQKSNQLLKDELLVDLFYHIQDHINSVSEKIDQFPSLKLSTKKETYQRISLAVDFMRSYYEKDISLEELAQVSCLSKFHFLRGFKAICGLTPYQYLLTIRLEKAMGLLRDSQLTIREIAELVGFEHVSSFSRAYQKKYKYYPSIERKENSNFG